MNMKMEYDNEEYNKQIEIIKKSALKKGEAKQLGVLSTNDYSDKALKKDLFYGAFAYLGIGIILSFFKSRKSKYVLFHVKQGLLLIIIKTVSVLCYGIIANLFSNIIFFSNYSSILEVLIMAFLFCLTVFGVKNALTGKMAYLLNVNILKEE